MEASALQRLPNTPMWNQYAEIKKDALDALLFYRMGDFYELFLDDAIEASSILGITLTARNKGEEIPIPMCGVPFHSAGNYINRLLRSGKRVAICEQTELAGASKGIVKREIVRIVSPGMVLDPDSLSSEESNYFLVLQLHVDGGGAYCLAELSTGSLEYATFTNTDQIRDDLSWTRPKEIVIATSMEDSATWKQFQQSVGKEYFPCISTAPDFYFSTDNASQDLSRHFQVLNLEGFGLNASHSALGVVGAAFRRIRDTQKLGTLQHLQAPRPRLRLGFVQLDESTMDHLDLFPKPNQNPEDSVYHHLNRTSTAMGARKLREVLARPLSEPAAILERQESVRELTTKPFLVRALKDLLNGIRDMERLLSKIGLKTAGPRDLQALVDIFSRLPDLKSQLLKNAHSALLSRMEKNIHSFNDLHSTLSSRLRDELPPVAREGNIFRAGWHKELDELIALTEDGKSFLLQMEAREKESTGIASLKIKYNKVFGYFIEVTNANLHLVPPHYIRKQTTANGERYLTDELKKFEDKILSAEEKRVALEEALFEEALQMVGAQSQSILTTARELALLDVLVSFSLAAVEHRYVAPEIVGESILEIQDGRHPALEHLVGKDKFIANSISFTPSEKIFLITGPNMAGKSTFMRQVALITLLAHTGSFVPAKKAKIGIADRIATRVGASDRIGRGQSTFMVEMNEMARILRQSTSKSLLIIDEIGRGTSTFDGLALAWAILEDIEERLGCRTLFATHYHELTLLEEHTHSIRNLCVAVEEKNQEVIFLHEVRRGKASGSYGIEVAKLAGLPAPVVQRASNILVNLDKSSSKLQKAQKDMLHRSRQMSLFSAMPPETAASPSPPDYLLSLEKGLRAINLDQCTPLDALFKLKGFKDSLPPPSASC